MNTLWLVCPLPHDKNKVWQIGAHGWRRWFYLNPDVETWRDTQRWRWMKDGISIPNEGTFEVDMYFHLPPDADGKWWDVDHGISNLLDTLTGVVYEDDSFVERVIATRDYDAPQGEAYVDIFIFWSPPILRRRDGASAP